MIILTSFKRLDRHVYDEAFSIARWQPKGSNLPTLPFLAANDKQGSKMLLRYYPNPVIGYMNTLREAYASRWAEIQPWLMSLDVDKTTALVCWCPYSTQTTKQIQKFGSFCCHNGLIGQMIQKHRPDITVTMDTDRKHKLVKEWRPI